LQQKSEEKKKLNFYFLHYQQFKNSEIMSKILVTGATGNVGKAVAQHLKNLNADFVVGIRDLSKAKSILGEGYNFVKFDSKDTSSFAEAFKGVSKLFLFGATLSEGSEKEMYPIIDYAKKVGVKHIVFLSASGAENNDNGHVRLTEKHIEKSGIAFTHLRPTFFMQNFVNFAGAEIKNGAFHLPAGNGATAFIDTNDIGLVAATILTHAGHENKAYTLTGSEAFTYAQAAELLSKHLGKKVEYRDIPAANYAAALKGYGMSDYATNFMVFLYDVVTKNGWASAISPEFEKITGKKPNTLENFIKQNLAAWK
jgi:uncharacterized protein YbjT (DUF2867 family)